MRIIHASDLQLGMRRRFFGQEAQSRYTDDQFNALAALAEEALRHSCDATVIAGDIFDDAVPDRRTVNRAIEAFSQFTMPVFLLPGNHDPSSPESLWVNGPFVERLPSNIVVLDDSTSHLVCGGDLEIFGAPWRSKRPDRDLVLQRLSNFDSDTASSVRVLVAHGGVDAINPDPGNPNLIHLTQLESALDEGKIHYVALGDRHSSLSVGPTGRVWYSGAPLMTSFKEDIRSTNRALLVDFGDEFKVEPIELGTWEFNRVEIAASGQDLLEAIANELARGGDRSRRAIRLVLEGTVNIAERSEIDRLIDEASDVYASVALSEESNDLAVVADDDDLAALRVGGYGDSAVAELLSRSQEGGEIGEDAILALRTLYRLVGAPA